MKTKAFYIVLLIVAATLSCKKNTPTSNSAPTTNTPPPPYNNCSSIGTPQDTAYNNTAKCFIRATSNPDNTITVYLTQGGSTSTSLSVSFLQLHTGTSCYESHNIIGTAGVLTFTLVIGPYPQSAIDTATTVAILQTSIDGNNFSLRDSKLNK